MKNVKNRVKKSLQSSLEHPDHPSRRSIAKARDKIADGLKLVFRTWPTILMNAPVVQNAQRC